MRIISLQAENVKRLKAVDVTLENGVVVISGKNGQGKSSLIDAVCYAFGGSAAQKLTKRPIRDGEDHAEVTVTLDDRGLVVRRTWKSDGPGTLTVSNADGSTFNSPQKMLDKLVGSLSFDPLGFTLMDAKTQLATLLDLVELPYDPDEMAAERQKHYDERHAAGQTLKTLQGQLAGLTEPSDDTPTEEVSPSSILAEQAEYQVKVEAERAAAIQIERLEGLGYDAEAEVEAAERAVEEAQVLLQRERARRAQIFEDLNAARIEFDSTGKMVKVDFQDRLAEVESANSQFREAQEYTRLVAERSAIEEAIDGHTAEIKALDESKEVALANAQMPIEGLAFDETGVTYGGIPFSQCSSAEQLRVSMAMGMALNPALRVLLVKDGSLLDSENMAIISEMATKKDFQILVERVDESGKVGIVIEDGSVKA